MGGGRGARCLLCVLNLLDPFLYITTVEIRFIFWGNHAIKAKLKCVLMAVRGTVSLSCFTLMAFLDSNQTSSQSKHTKASYLPPWTHPTREPTDTTPWEPFPILTCSSDSTNNWNQINVTTVLLKQQPASHVMLDWLWVIYCHMQG